jgi:inner membrane protein
LILENNGNEFLLTDGDGVYRTGEQIIVDKLTTEIGAAATTVIQTLNFSDEHALPKLQELQRRIPMQRFI